MNMGRIILFLLIWHNIQKYITLLWKHVLIFSAYVLLAAVVGKKYGDPHFLLTEHFPWGKSNQMTNYKKIL